MKDIFKEQNAKSKIEKTTFFFQCNIYEIKRNSKQQDIMEKSKSRISLMGSINESNFYVCKIKNTYKIQTDDGILSA